MKKIILWVLKNKKRVSFFIKLWLKWSMFYQYIELKFMGIALKEDIIYKDKFDINDSSDWQIFCKKNGIYHYKSDKWYMGFDVISHPLRSVYRKGVDCDDYALLSYYRYGDHIFNHTNKYDKVGMVIYNWEDGSSHAVFVWKNSILNDYIVISNNEIAKVSNLEHLFNKKVKYFSLIDVFFNEKNDRVNLDFITISEPNNFII